ncbi:hypothetical protein BDD12DRAFT_944077 [Trichophaea hybrida]|nr:hypothetical protein BDD12DRAFT_944077 [Trichophaea hybrida]
MSSNFSPKQPSASAPISTHNRDPLAALIREYVNELKEEYDRYCGKRPTCPKKRKWEEEEEEEEEDHPNGVQELQAILGFPVDKDPIIIPPPPLNTSVPEGFPVDADTTTISSAPPNTPVPENVFEDVYLGDEDEDWEVVTGAEVANAEVAGVEVSGKMGRQRRTEEKEKGVGEVLVEEEWEEEEWEEESDDEEEDEDDF